MNPVTMTSIDPRKEYWSSRGSNQRPPVLKSATLLTELWGWAFEFYNPHRILRELSSTLRVNANFFYDK